MSRPRRRPSRSSHWPASGPRPHDVGIFVIDDDAYPGGIAICVQLPEGSLAMAVDDGERFASSLLQAVAAARDHLDEIGR